MQRMTDPDLYRLNDLVDLTGFTPRAITYFRTLRILPPPVGVRSQARYTPLHLQILKELKRRRDDRSLSLVDKALDVQTRYPTAFPTHERHPDLGA